MQKKLFTSFLRNMNSVLIGVGRYGNKLVGYKYVHGEIDSNLIGAVDPNIDSIKQRADYSLNNTKTYRNIYELPDDIFTKETVFDIALLPKYVQPNFDILLNKGAQNIIFPKPVTSSKKSYKKIRKAIKRENIKGAVASNWFYSEITKFAKILIAKTKGKSYKFDEDTLKYKNEIDSALPDLQIKKVTIDYNKKEETLAIDPPLQELPHALQIVQSTGLADLNHVRIKLNKDEQTKSRVTVNLADKVNKKYSIEIKSDLNMGEKLDKKRERLVKIYLDDDDEDADIIIDYDAEFEKENCIKKPSIEYDVTKNDKNIYWKREIEEDNINSMYDNMYNFFKNPKYNKTLTLDKYKPIFKTINKIQKMWEKKIN